MTRLATTPDSSAVRPDLEVSAQLAARGLDLQFAVSAGEVLAVLGPNGAGKSSLAAVIAGVVAADRAVVRVGDRTVTDTASGRQVPPHRRRVGLLSQNPMLFPHLSVLGNVVFAARRRSRSRAESVDAAGRWLQTVGVAELASRRPAELSGGQAQRVAIARALAAEPDVLVLDEPLAGLDVAAAAALRAVLGTVTATQGRAVILITHDLLDVLALADRVLVMESGRIAETGPVRAVLAAPRSPFAARIAGVNLIGGVLSDGGAVRSADGRTWHGVPDDALRAGQEVVGVFPPSAVAVFRDQPHGSPRNGVRVVVSGLEVMGAVVRVRTEDQADGVPGLAADITPEAAVDLRLAVGESVWLSVKAQEVRLHPARTARGEREGRHD